MRRVLGFAASLVALCSWAQAKSPPCPTFRFELRHSVSVRELREMGSPEVAHGADAFSFTPFDSEDHPTMAGWHAAGFLMVARGDLGETPVAGIVWSNKSTELGPGPTLSYRPHAQDRGDVTAVQILGVPATASCPQAALAIALHVDGRVDVNGKPVGKIVSP